MVGAGLEASRFFEETSETIDSLYQEQVEVFF